MTTQEGQGTAGEVKDPGAADSQSNDTEVSELRSKLEAANTLVSERDAELVTTKQSVADLQAANQKFADDAVSRSNQEQQLKDAQQALEESRKTSSDLTTQLEVANVRNTELHGQALTRRRQDLTSKFGLSEERVAGLDEAGLAVLESTLPHVSAVPQDGQKPTAPLENGNGLGLNPGGNDSADLSSLTESERALRTIERLKEK